MQSGPLSVAVRETQYHTLNGCQCTLPATSLLYVPLLCCGPFSPLSPECSTGEHDVSQHPALNEKGLLKFIKALRASRSACHIPAVPAQDRGDKQERTAFYFGLFMYPFLHSFTPGARGYRILLKRTISLIE